LFLPPGQAVSSTPQGGKIIERMTSLRTAPLLLDDPVEIPWLRIQGVG
jgi:hypothetical protein